MIGVCLCHCGAKAVAACSGHATPGFQQAVANCGFELADAMPDLSPNQQRNLTQVGRGPVWSCAAPKMIKALDGHKPRTMTEMFYQQGAVVTASYEYVDKRGARRELTRMDSFPRTEGVRVQYRRTEDGETAWVEQTFGNGATTPSCDRCKVNLPEMLCNVDELCP
jgi:hypothetical protein